MTVRKNRLIISSFLLISLAVLLFAAPTAAAEDPEGWQRYEYPLRKTAASPYSCMYYWVYTPAELKPGLPMVVYLHSTAGMMNSALREKERGLPALIVSGDIPAPEAIVLVPQHPGTHEDYWDSVLYSVTLLVEKVAREYQVDRSRIALTGYSLGGIGMWDLVAAKPRVYSRLLCVDGKINRRTQRTDLFTGSEVRVYTAHLDPAVNTASAINFVKKLNDAGIPASHTQLENTTHQEIPKIVYTDKSVQEWLWLRNTEEPDPVVDPAR